MTRVYVPHEYMHENILECVFLTIQNSKTTKSRLHSSLFIGVDKQLFISDVIITFPTSFQRAFGLPVFRSFIYIYIYTHIHTYIYTYGTGYTGRSNG